MDKLQRGIEHERRYSPMGVEHCFAAGLMRDVAALAADLDMVEIR
jgi:hypothetical protein